MTPGKKINGIAWNDKGLSNTSQWWLQSTGLSEMACGPSRLVVSAIPCQLVRVFLRKEIT